MLDGSPRMTTVYKRFSQHRFSVLVAAVNKFLLKNILKRSQLHALSIDWPIICFHSNLKIPQTVCIQTVGKTTSFSFSLPPLQYDAQSPACCLNIVLRDVTTWTPGGLSHCSLTHIELC